MTCRFFLCQNFPQSCCQFCLQINRVILSYIHGLYMNVHFFGLLRNICLALNAGINLCIPKILLVCFILQRTVNLRIFRQLLFARYIRSFCIYFFLIRFFCRHLCSIEIIKSMVIFFLLIRSKRLMQHLQFHSLNNVFTVTKP